MRKFVHALFFAAVFAAAQLPRPAGAYELAGHFYTVWALAKTSEVPVNEDQNEHLLVALCAQLPDLAREANAVNVYADMFLGSPLQWAWWGTTTGVGNRDVRHMITVQQLLHALTGGDAQSTHKVARRLVSGALDALGRTPAQDRPVALCALGFALHFFSDSLSHRDLSDTSAAPRMYVTGRGHGVHLSFPDFPLCARGRAWFPAAVRCYFTPQPGQRFDAWVQSWAEIDWPCADPTCKTPDSERDLRIQRRKMAMLKRAADLGPSANDDNRWNEADLGRAFAYRGETTSPVAWALPYPALQFLEKSRSVRLCAEVVKDIQALFGKWPEIAALECDRVWKTYTALAAAAFDGADVDNARAVLDRKVPFCEIYSQSMYKLGGPGHEKVPCPPTARAP